MSLNAGQSASGALKLCLICVPEDQKLSAEVEKYLRSLERQGLISIWSGQDDITAGSDEAQALEEQLATADLIVCLLSTDFFNSENYAGLSSSNVIERYNRGEVRLIPVLLHPMLPDVDPPGLPLSRLKRLPSEDRPVTDWPDREAALQNVALGIKQVIESLVAGQPLVERAVGGWWNVPYPQNKMFTGREDLLALLYVRLTIPEASTPLIQVLTGLGGIGKTQLALEYVYRYAQMYSAVLWLNADSSERLASDGLLLAQTLRLPERNDPDQRRVLDALQRWLQQHQDWLLVLDNAEHLELVTHFLPPRYQGHVLVTTRSHVMGTRAEEVPVPPLTLAEGTQFLLRRAHIRQSDMEARAARIVEMFEGLPLALDQAGAYLEETGVGLARYAQYYPQMRAKLLNRRGRAAQESGHAESVMATFLLAFEQLEQDYPPAADLLRLCAFLHPVRIPESLLCDDLLPQPLLPGIADGLELDVALGTLLQFSLVSRDPEMHNLSMHRLVQDVLREAMTEPQERVRAEQAVVLVSRAWPEPVAANWERCLEYLPHALVCAELLERWRFQPQAGVNLLLNVGIYLNERAFYEQAGRVLRQALACSETSPEVDELVTARILRELGWLAHRQDSYAPAEEYYRRSLAIYAARLGMEDLQTAQTLQKIALLHLNRNEYVQAEALLMRILAIREQHLGLDQPEVAETLETLARLARVQQNYPLAEECYLRALAINELRLGVHAPETARNLSNLATLYANQKKYELAEPLYLRALVLREALLGPDHPDTAQILDALATAYSSQAKYSQAEPLSRRALTIQRQVLGLEHRETAQSLHTLAMICYGLGDYAEAEELCTLALKVRETLPGSRDPRLATNLSDLALIYQSQQRYEQALPLYRRALQLSIELRGREHASTRIIEKHLMELHQQLGLPAEISDLDEQASTAQEQEPPTENDQK